MNDTTLRRELDAHPSLTMRLWYRTVYLFSRHWQALRLAAKRKHGECCARCGTVRNLDVHHLRYRRIYDVTPDDLQVLCRACHKTQHAPVRSADDSRPRGMPRRLWAAWLASDKKGAPPSKHTPKRRKSPARHQHNGKVKPKKKRKKVKSIKLTTRSRTHTGRMAALNASRAYF